MQSYVMLSEREDIFSVHCEVEVEVALERIVPVLLKRNMFSVGTFYSIENKNAVGYRIAVVGEPISPELVDTLFQITRRDMYGFLDDLYEDVSAEEAFSEAFEAGVEIGYVGREEKTPAEVPNPDELQRLYDRLCEDDIDAAIHVSELCLTTGYDVRLEKKVTNEAARVLYNALQELTPLLAGICLRGAVCGDDAWQRLAELMSVLGTLPVTDKLVRRTNPWTYLFVKALVAILKQEPNLAFFEFSLPAILSCGVYCDMENIHTDLATISKQMVFMEEDQMRLDMMAANYEEYRRLSDSNNRPIFTLTDFTNERCAPALRERLRFCEGDRKTVSRQIEAIVVGFIVETMKKALGRKLHGRCDKFYWERALRDSACMQELLKSVGVETDVRCFCEGAFVLEGYRRVGEYTLQLEIEMAYPYSFLSNAVHLPVISPELRRGTADERHRILVSVDELNRNPQLGKIAGRADKDCLSYVVGYPVDEEEFNKTAFLESVQAVIRHSEEALKRLCV